MELMNKVHKGFNGGNHYESTRFGSRAQGNKVQDQAVNAMGHTTDTTSLYNKVRIEMNKNCLDTFHSNN